MILQATKSDIREVVQIAAKLWSNHTIDELAMDFDILFADNHTAVFLCYENNTAIGFAQCQLRQDYVEGTYSSPVGYLEGIFVEAEYRNCGYAKMLLSACEQWAKQRGCTEFASDCELNNHESFAFHIRTGFREANRIICFTKKI